MIIRKYVAGAALAGALGVSGIGLAGVASATPAPPGPPPGSTTSCNGLANCNSKTVTVNKSKTATTGDIKVGNINQGGAILSGNIQNNQTNSGNTASSGGVNQNNTTTQQKQLILLGIPVNSSKTFQGASTGAASNDNVSSNGSSVNTATSKNNRVNVN